MIVRKKEKDLENAKEIVAEFKRRVNIEVRWQEGLNIEEEEKKNFKREELPRKYMTKMLYEWDDGKFEMEYLKKLERN